MSCLFQSLAPAVNLKSEELRDIITKYLSTNPALIDDIKLNDIIKWNGEGSLETYINKMSRNEWGGCIEIRAFCKLFNMDVIIHFKQNIIEVNCGGKPVKIVHIRYTGSHYDPLYIRIS